MNNYLKDFEKFATRHIGLSSIYLYQYISKTHYPDILSFTPYILEERQSNIAALDVFSRLMMERIIFLGTPIDDYIANVINAQLLYMQSVDPKRDISIYINSPGGSVYAGLGMYDVMQHVAPEISTVCTGIAASMAAILLAAGSPKKRMALPHARIMIHQPLGGAQGQASDVEIVAEQIRKIKTELYNILSLHTGQTFDKIWKDADRDYWMIAQEAKEYGIIDEVLTNSLKARKSSE
ncbi:MAG: ATP-dependent Clp protease proteolytic subunit [Bacteroidia bacterium]|nr:ATP-dependent Clp protease proteolytic subunit [Bacteroidia bacterium]MDW8159575.1 ATP-dependent Clp protease proteolytic subunit [Bacteroidia bacterium]